jgi:hypothetical protein
VDTVPGINLALAMVLVLAAAGGVAVLSIRLRGGKPIWPWRLTPNTISEQMAKEITRAVLEIGWDRTLQIPALYVFARVPGRIKALIEADHALFVRRVLDLVNEFGGKAARARGFTFAGVRELFLLLTVAQPGEERFLHVTPDKNEPPPWDHTSTGRIYRETPTPALVPAAVPFPAQAPAAVTGQWSDPEPLSGGRPITVATAPLPGADAPAQFSLVFKEPGFPDTRFAFAEGDRVRIGRDGSREIMVRGDHPGVSRRHATIILEPYPVISDESGLGTYVEVSPGQWQRLPKDMPTPYAVPLRLSLSDRHEVLVEITAISGPEAT